ncbi:MAG: zinc ribbon domain-containing protein [Anaerolineales bacterium]|nr:zinc ribbon domain-containing protein [Anaerolineales bacterium]
MELGAILIGLVILILSLLFLMAPFKPGQRKKVKPTVANPAAERAAALAALRDLDFDFKIGKVSEEDYPTLRAGLLAEAARYIQQEEANEADIEARIQARKRTQGKSSTAYCPHCGKPVIVGDLFCTSCGSRLEVRTAEAG